jgi:aromatic ring-opening dioxygenase LigB subunit
MARNCTATLQISARRTATIHAELDEDLLNEITPRRRRDELVVLRTRGRDLDHGTAVPLYFLQRNGWQGRVIALGYSFLSNEDHVRFGKCIRQSIEKSRSPRRLHRQRRFESSPETGCARRLQS